MVRRSGRWYWEFNIKKFVPKSGNSWMLAAGVLPKDGKECKDCLGDNFSYVAGTGKTILNCEGSGYSYSSTYGEGTIIGEWNESFLSVHGIVSKGVGLDLDSKTLSFFRNGINLGVAFSKELEKFQEYYAYIAFNSCEALVVMSSNLTMWIEMYEPERISQPIKANVSPKEWKGSTKSSGELKGSMGSRELLKSREELRLTSSREELNTTQDSLRSAQPISSREDLSTSTDDRIVSGDSHRHEKLVESEEDPSGSLSGAWTAFLLACGFSRQVSRKYAQAFSSNEIELDMIPQLTDSEFERLGVSTVGHRFRIRKGVASATCNFHFFLYLI